MPFGPREKTDPELQALPEPRRPWRRLTLVTMGTTGLLALGMAYAFRVETLYSLQSGRPTHLGELSWAAMTADRANHWAQGEGQLGSTGAIRYARPLESDTFRLAPVADDTRLWVEIRVPRGLEGSHFVPPVSFVGRLVPFSKAGLQHRGLPAEVKSITNLDVPPDAWLLVDGESPQGLRWAAALMLLFLAFFSFNAYGLYRILRPPRDP
jgi:hypothetical protein